MLEKLKMPKPKMLVKTSIYVPEELHAELRLYVAKQLRGTSLNAVMVTACRAYLKAQRVAVKAKKLGVVLAVAPPTVGGPIS